MVQAGDDLGVERGGARGGRLAALAFVGAFVLLGAAAEVDGKGKGISGSKHDLSARGGGQYSAMEESEVCKFCHITHTAAPASPLWNRRVEGRAYSPYWSSTARERPGQPDGASRLCLSCHDGTVALGELLSDRGRKVRMRGEERLGPNRGGVGLDLSNDHPVSLDYTRAEAAAGGELLPRHGIPSPVRLDKAGRVQCTSCHDPHDDQYGSFLVRDNQFGQLCLSCHAPRGWRGSGHQRSPARRQAGGLALDELATGASVAEAACSACHAQHGAGRGQRLLRHADDEGLCLGCHDGSVARSDIRREVEKPFGHRSRASMGVHDAAEDPSSMPSHVECVDCHDPHEAGPQQGGLPGALSGAPGVDDSGWTVARASTTREVCFRCHGDRAVPVARRVVRQVDERSVRRRVDPSNPSHHAVRAPRGAPSPSLLATRASGSTIDCTDCHGSDSEGSGGPRGPHGSRWPFLLAARYDTAAGQESPEAYALCYRCHDRSSILGDRSFSGHSRHVRDVGASCATCHDPHGVPSSGDAARSHRALINFDTSVVSPLDGVLELSSRGPGGGTCTLICHGERHERRPYGQEEPR